MSRSTRRLLAGADDDAQEAELGIAEDHSRSFVQWQRSHRVHSGRRSQLARTLDRTRSWRSCSRFARRALPSRSRMRKTHSAWKSAASHAAATARRNLKRIHAPQFLKSKNHGTHYRQSHAFETRSTLRLAAWPGKFINCMMWRRQEGRRSRFILSGDGRNQEEDSRPRTDRRLHPSTWKT